MSQCFISLLMLILLAFVSSQHHQVVNPPFQPSQQFNPPQSRAQPQSQPKPQPRLQQQPQPQTQPQPRPQPQLRPQKPQRLEARPPQPQTLRYVPFSNPAPPAQSSSPHTYGYHKIIDPSTNQVLYHRTYNVDNNSHHETRYWYNTGNQAAQPIVARALAGPYQVPLTNLPGLTPREPTYRPLQPAPLTNANYQTNRQPLNQRDVDQHDYPRSAENSIEYSSPVISRSSVPSWLDNIESLVSFIKSPTFISQLGSFGSQLSFRSQVVADKSTEDDKLISYNNEHSGLNFTYNKDDCKPKLTTIKLGSPERPEIIYNPSSVEILRCPQACFSWQFDCAPTKTAAYNFTVATYVINGDAMKNRKVDQFTIESHVACACQCRSLASCLGNITFSPQRLQPSL